MHQVYVVLACVFFGATVIAALFSFAAGVRRDRMERALQKIEQDDAGNRLPE